VYFCIKSFYASGKTALSNSPYVDTASYVPPQPLHFRHETIDANVVGTTPSICLITDVNSDGRPDVIVGVQYADVTVFWYENPTWERHDMGSPQNLQAGGALGDINGDGRLDVVVAQAGGGHDLYWLECPEDPTQPWTTRLITNSFLNYHDQAIGDVDDDGQIEVVTHSQGSQVLVYYKIPPDPTVQPWPAVYCHTVATGLVQAEGLAIADLDGDGRTEIIGGPYIFSRPAGETGLWTKLALPGSYKKTRVAVGNLAGDPRPEIVLSEGESASGRLAWFSPPNWTAAVLHDDLFHPHSLAIADFDGDGLNDIFTGEMNLDVNLNPRLYIFLNKGNGTFEAVLVSQGIETHEARVADMNGDGRPDIVGKSCNPGRHADIWYNEP